MDFLTVENGPVILNVAVAGAGPLILCLHGFPELWHAWRPQIAHFAARGYTVAAMDLRGYGGSSKPPEIAAYTLRAMASDVAAVIDRLGGRAILFGHDWGAPLAWTTALLHPSKVAAVAGLGVPHIPRGDIPFLTLARAVYAGRYFYQLYFQAEGPAEREIEADLPAALRKIYFAWSGGGPKSGLCGHKPATASFLDGMVDPNPLPAWLDPADLALSARAFRQGGLRGPINRYRAQDLDFADRAALAGRPVTQPALFLAGARDPVRSLIPGRDLYADPGRACTDFRGAALLPGIGHWVQREAPAACNAVLERFLDGL